MRAQLAWLLALVCWVSGCATSAGRVDEGHRGTLHYPPGLAVGRAATSLTQGAWPWERHQEDLCAWMQESAGLEQGVRHPAGKPWRPQQAQRLWEWLARHPVSRANFAPRTALAYLARESLEEGRDVPAAEWQQRCKRFLRLLVLRPDGYLASAVTGDAVERMGRVEWRQGAWRAGRFRVGAFYLSNGGVFFPVDERLRQSDPTPLGELSLRQPLVLVAVDGAGDAMGELAQGLAALVVEPVRSAEGLLRLPQTVASLIASSPEYFAHYGNLTLDEQVREAARLSTHLLMLAGGGAFSGARIAGSGATITRLTVGARGTLALERVVVPAGAASASAGLRVLMSAAKPPPPEALDSWIARAPRKAARKDSKPYRYQVEQAGPEEFLLRGGGEEIWADGIRRSDAHILEVKFIEHPEISPFILGSRCDDTIRAVIQTQERQQFKKYAAVLKDPATPLVGLEVILNDIRAAPFFEAILSELGIAGRVVAGN